MEQAPNRTHAVALQRFAWALAWGLPVVALIVGISLTSTRSTEVWTPAGDGTHSVFILEVWPAGLVLLGAGVIGVTAAAIATAIVVASTAKAETVAIVPPTDSSADAGSAPSRSAGV